MYSFLLLIGVVAVVLFAPGPTNAQIELEIYGSAGYTQVDVDKWAGSNVLDWDQFTSGFHIQGWYRPSDRSRFSVGAELGYQYLLFYQARYGIYRLDHDVDATRIMGLLRLPLGERALFMDVGAGAYLFEDFTDLALTVAVGRAFGLSQRLRVPVKFRADVLFDEDAMMIPFGLTVGLTYDLSQ
jgi:hypothetical protein